MRVEAPLEHVSVHVEDAPRVRLLAAHRMRAAGGLVTAPGDGADGLLVVVVLLAIFFFQNGEEAPVDFLWMSGNWPVWLVIGVSVVVGIVLDRLGTWQWRRARRNRDGG